ncbi:MAG TPA: O-antigen ligase family protein [Lacunisphaera sp.]|nr:O-antigen ligase family protein [Lacunisphaera sp.]
MLLHRFRAERKHLPLHPLEKAVLTVVALHLCFLPWAIGTMHAWSQVTSLVFATIGFGLALIPRTYSGGYVLPVRPPGPQVPPQVSGFRPQVSVFRLTMWPRLLRFPIFWIGLALLGYITVQGFNPSWIWERNATTWWLRRVDDIPWLPTSIDTPWERFNLWRQFVIYASAWLTVGTVWVGFTRRRSLEILLLVIALNGTLQAFTGLVFRLFRPAYYLLWSRDPYGEVTTFASFIYKNHAGAWLALIAATLITLAALFWQRDLKKMARSSSSTLFLVGAVVVFTAEGYTYSRGGTIILAGYLLLASVAFVAQRLRLGRGAATHPAVAWIVGLLVLACLGYAARNIDFRGFERRFVSLLAFGQEDVSRGQRELAYLAGWQYLRDHGLRGVGAGGFRYLFPEYIKRFPEIYNGGHLFWEHAHNDWLETPIELGVAGSLLILSGGIWWISRLFRLRPWRHLPSLLLTAGLSQTLLHAIFDFPFQSPAVLVTWLTLAALSLHLLELDVK